MNGYESIKQIPYSLEAEQAVLGGILVDPDNFLSVAQILRSTDFYIDRHIEIYGVMQTLFTESKRIDFVTVIDRLEKKGVYTKEEGMQYVKRLADSVPSISNIVEYANIIRDKSMLRKLIKAANEIAESAYDPIGSAADTVDAAEQKIFDIAQDKVGSDFSHIRDVLVTNLSALQDIMDNPDKTRGVKTYFPTIDKLLVEMGEGDLIIVGARPGMGKTSFAMNIAENVARFAGKAVAVFSLEMSSEQLVLRMLTSTTMIDGYVFRTGKMTDEHWSKVSLASSTLSECDIWIDDSGNITTTAMKAKLRRIKNLGLVVIDYLQLMRGDRKYDSNVLEVSDITRNLKLMAKELNIPIIVASQLSRANEKRGEASSSPVLSDLRDSGSIEQDADVVMFINRDYYNKKGEETINAAEIIIAKNRHGTTGKVQMGWFGNYYRFIESADQYDGQEPPRQGKYDNAE